MQKSCRELIEESTDSRLCQLWQEQQHDLAYSVLRMRYFERGIGFALRSIRQREDVEEAVTRSFDSAIQSFTVTGGSPFWPYMKTILENRIKLAINTAQFFPLSKSELKLRAKLKSAGSWDSFIAGELGFQVTMDIGAVSAKTVECLFLKSRMNSARKIPIELAGRDESSEDESESPVNGEMDELEAGPDSTDEDVSVPCLDAARGIHAVDDTALLGDDSARRVFLRRLFLVRPDSQEPTNPAPSVRFVDPFERRRWLLGRYNHSAMRYDECRDSD